MKKQKQPTEKMKISFDDVPTKFKPLPKEIPSKIISNEKTLVGNKEKVSLSFPSPDNTQKKGKKFGELRSLFHKKSPVIALPSQSPILSEKIEESDEVTILENEIKQKLELIKQKQEKKRITIEEEKKRIEEEQKKIELEKLQEKKKTDELKKVKKTICKVEEPINFEGLEELTLIPKNTGTSRFCDKCGTKMKKKWVKSYGNIYTQEFRCKNKLCKNVKLLEIKI